MADGPADVFEVPLFPLNVVLFPGMALPLHIFEPRYRQMVADCLADQAPFGVVLALTQSEVEHEVPAKIGTLARIADYEQLPDGRYNLLALGTRRFEILEERHEHLYSTGRVRPVRDESEGDDEASVNVLVREARAALKDYLRVVLTLVGSEQREIEIPENASDLSFVIGMCLTCEDCDKQELLEMRSVQQRLRVGTRKLHAESALLEHQIESSPQRLHGQDRTLLN